MGKILGIIVLVFFSLFAIIIIIDLKIGYSLEASIYKTINPFQVMETPELIVSLALIFYYVFKQLAMIFIKKFKNTKNSSSSSG